jgi:hypothetical protein
MMQENIVVLVWNYLMKLWTSINSWVLTYMAHYIPTHTWTRQALSLRLGHTLFSRRVTTLLAQAAISRPGMLWLGHFLTQSGISLDHPFTLCWADEA